MLTTSKKTKLLNALKAFSLDLSDKHLRQAINYGANEGIEWILLTNGKSFDFYKILFNKPIDSRKVFSVDLTDMPAIKTATGHLQYLHRESIAKKGLKQLWNKCEALFPENVAGIIYSKEVINTIRKLIKAKYGEKCDDEEIMKTLEVILCEKFDPLLIKPYRYSGKSERRSRKPAVNESAQISSLEEGKEVGDMPAGEMN